MHHASCKLNQSVTPSASVAMSVVVVALYYTNRCLARNTLFNFKSDNKTERLLIALYVPVWKFLLYIQNFISALSLINKRKSLKNTMLNNELPT